MERTLTMTDINRMQEARDVHKKTGVLCKNCTHYQETGGDEIIRWGKCMFRDYTNEENYCMGFRFK
jgi:hypothetical protein